MMGAGNLRLPSASNRHDSKKVAGHQVVLFRDIWLTDTRKVYWYKKGLGQAVKSL